MKYLRYLLITLCSINFSSFCHGYDFTVDGIYYNITDKTNHELCVTYKTSSDKGYSGNVEIPSYVNYNGEKFTVTSIQRDAFSGTNITSLRMSDSIKKITGSYGFYNCKILSNIYLSKNLEAIPDDSFSNCSALTEISIPSSVQEIGGEAFGGCTALYKFTIEDAANSLKIRTNIFSSVNSSIPKCPITYLYLGRNLSTHFNSNKESLLEITLGKYVTTINKEMFSNYSSLKKINGEFAQIREIGADAFTNCKNLQNEDINKLLQNVESVGDYAFYGCSNLKVLFLPKVHEIGRYSFDGCDLTEIYIGNDLVAIPYKSFTSNYNLERIYIGTALESIDYSFGSNTSLKYIFLCSDNLNKIDSRAIPTTVSRIYVPNTARYENLLKDYYLDNLITLNPSTSEYSGKAPTFSYNNNVEGAEISFDSPELNINAGEYQTGIPVTFTIGDWSSTIKVNGSYTITPATLNVIANDVTRKYGEDNPTLECSFFGFKNSETESVLTKKPVIETTATKLSNAGTYPIIPYGAEAQNYTFNYERGTLTITKAEQTITWNQNFDNITVGDVIELTAESSAGLQIKYTATDDAIADIYTQNGKRYVEFLKPGTVSIRANQDGNENYNEADRVSKSITVNAKSVPVTGIALNQTSLTLKVDESFKLVATITPTDATSQLVNWSSDNETVATVGNDGRVYAEAAGNATITAECGGVKATCSVVVLAPELNGISLDRNEIEIDISDDAIMLNVTYSPDNAIKPQLYWTSSNESVAKVVSEGDLQAKVIPIAAGKATITVQVMTNAAMRDVCELTVTHKQDLVENIFADDAEVNVDIYTLNGQIIKLKADKGDVEALKPGLYIINGSIVVIK